MAIDFKRPLENIDGTEIKAPMNNKVLTLADACAGSLLASYKDEEGISADTKVARYKLAWKIINAENPLDLEPEEVVMIRKMVHKNYGTLIVGQVYDIVR